MECYLCANAYSKTRKPICASCAQATLYDPRLRQATSLLSRENAHTHAEAIVRPGNDGILAALPQDADWDAIASGVKTNSRDRAEIEKQRVEARIVGITEQAELLRKQIEDYRLYAGDTRRKHEARRQEIAKGREELNKRKPLAIDPVKHAIRKTSQRLDKAHSRTVNARAYLCRHTSLLCRLRQVKDKHGRHTGQIELDGLTIPNLKEFSNRLERANAAGKNTDADTPGVQHFEHINACLDSVCHLLGMWCHYLSIRLPAEIILPHADFPHSAILPEKSSYKGFDPIYPAILSSHSTSPSASHLIHDQHDAPRPRLLHLDRPLARLAKEDTKAFGLFVEGVMLLAWNIAWLCRSQGIDKVDNFESVCDMGRNLYLLARAQDASNALRPSLDRPDTTATEASARTKKSTTTRPQASVGFGSYTHGNLHHFLAGASGAALMQNWRLAQPHRLIDKLRNYLLNEITGAEWDVLSDGDFDDERADEVPVLVGGAKRKVLQNRHPAMSVMTVAADADGRPRGEAGWMKVRGRNGDAER